MKRIITKIGDIFCVKLHGGGKRYFQYIANDMSQLNSSVIRVFEKAYTKEDNPILAEIVKDDVDFYAHVVLRWGIEKGLWEKVGKASELGSLDILFRSSKDYGSKPGELVEVSERWYVWKINEPFRYVGKLEGENRSAEIGVVISPVQVYDRIRTGKYHFFFPRFE